MTDYAGEERRHPADVQLMLARLEAKLDALADVVKVNGERVSAAMDDHEARLRALEAAYHLLATREDLDEIEVKREAQLAERQRKITSWITVIIALVVPIEAAVIAYLIQRI